MYHPAVASEFVLSKQHEYTNGHQVHQCADESAFNLSLQHHLFPLFISFSFSLQLHSLNMSSNYLAIFAVPVHSSKCTSADSLAVTQGNFVGHPVFLFLESITTTPVPETSTHYFNPPPNQKPSS